MTLYDSMRVFNSAAPCQEEETRLLSYGSLASLASPLEAADPPPKYEECEDLPPGYDEATMARPGDQATHCDHSFENKAFQH